jgi:2-methylcitrate dehydratase PrpD
MPARNGVSAALFVQSGFTGVSDPFSGEENFFEITSPESRPELLADALGSHFDVMFTYMKKYPVGGPIQAALDALLVLIEKYALKATDVQSISVYMPHVGPVDNSGMPSVNLHYILAATLLDGKMTFDMAHSYERMSEPAVVDLKSRITLVEDAGLFKAGVLRQAIVEITRKDGTKLKEHVANWRGKPENPMTREEVEKKSRDLLLPVLGEERSQKLIDSIWNLEQIRNMRELRPFLSAS